MESAGQTIRLYRPSVLPRCHEQLGVSPRAVCYSIGMKYEICCLLLQFSVCGRDSKRLATRRQGSTPITNRSSSLPDRVSVSPKLGHIDFGLCEDNHSVKSEWSTVSQGIRVS